MKFNSMRLVLIAGLALLVGGVSGCGGKDKCETDADCGTDKICNTDNRCVAAPDRCADKVCPGARTCNPADGECTGDCCTAERCTGRTKCDENLCIDGQPPCVPKVCEPACEADFVCNQFPTPPVCEAACETQRCTEYNAHCDTVTGACEPRLPDTTVGEVGSPCTVNSDCDVSAGLQCDTRFPNGYCSKSCSADVDCPSGSFCVDNICYDACVVADGDCLPNLQCISVTGDVADRCFPIFDVSECQTNCKPNTMPCDPDVADECEEGSACVDFTSGAVCQNIGCHLFNNPCGVGETCSGIGIGLTSCFTLCDPTDPTACTNFTDGTQTLTCVQSPTLDGPGDGYFITDDITNCATTDFTDTATVTIGTEDVTACYKECTVNGDCGPGQFCSQDEVTFLSGDVLTFNTCKNYDVATGTCAGSVCATSSCTDFTGTAAGFAICHEGCSTDADCTADFGGSCSRVEFLTGDSISICLYETAGAFCLFSCATNEDCGYCSLDADCPNIEVSTGVFRQQRCDLQSHSCVMPLIGVAEVAAFCRASEGLDSDAILIDAVAGTRIAGCGVLCLDDADCARDTACVADSSATAPDTGFCARQTDLCNGPTGQCESSCSAPAAGAAECLHSTCEAGDGPNGENRCVLACTTTADCGPGVCDTNLGYCVDTLPPQIFDLTFDGTGYGGNHEGEVIEIAVVDSTGAVIATDAVLMDFAGILSFSWPGLLTENETYTVDFYADQDNSEDCVFGGDHAWQETIAAVTANVAITRDHNTLFFDVCSSFSGLIPRFELSFVGTGYGLHDGQTLYVALMDGTTLVASDSAVVAGGTFAFEFVNVLTAATNYNLDFYADVTGNGTCEASPTDHVWRVALAVAGADITVSETHNVTFTDAACASF